MRLERASVCGARFWCGRQAGRLTGGGGRGESSSRSFVKRTGCVVTHSRQVGRTGVHVQYGGYTRKGHANWHVGRPNSRSDGWKTRMNGWMDGCWSWSRSWGMLRNKRAGGSQELVRPSCWSFWFLWSWSGSPRFLERSLFGSQKRGEVLCKVLLLVLAEEHRCSQPPPTSTTAKQHVAALPEKRHRRAHNKQPEVRELPECVSRAATTRLILSTSSHAQERTSWSV